MAEPKPIDLQSWTTALSELARREIMRIVGYGSEYWVPFPELTTCIAEDVKGGWVKDFQWEEKQSNQRIGRHHPMRPWAAKRFADNANQLTIRAGKDLLRLAEWIGGYHYDAKVSEWWWNIHREIQKAMERGSIND
jgi:hypothetical protein